MAGEMFEREVFYAVVDDELFDWEKRVHCGDARKLAIYSNTNGQLTIPKNLKYFKKPHPTSYPLDLNLGFEDFKYRQKEYFKNSLKFTEKYLMENDGRSLLRATEKQVICTSRNTLIALMHTPYNMRSGVCNNWTIQAIKFNDVLYLVNCMQPTKTPKTGTYHYKFQQYCFADTPTGEPDTDEPVDENMKMACILRKSIGEFDLFYSSDVVGVESKHEIEDFSNEQTLNECHFVKTKLLNLQNNPNYNWKKDPKIFKWWLQSYLGCGEKIYYGFRNKYGFVQNKVNFIKYTELPKQQKWKPEVCERFLHGFLTKVSEKMSNLNCPHTVYEFNFDGKMRSVKCDRFDKALDKGFLSQQFIEHMQLK